MTFARRSRSTSACFAIARFIVSGRSNVAHLDEHNLDAPGLRALVDHLLELLVDPIALTQELVQLMLTEDAAQGRLSEQEGRLGKVLDFYDRVCGINDAEIDTASTETGTLSRVISSWRGTSTRDDAQVDSDHPIDDRNEKDHAGSLGT